MAEKTAWELWREDDNGNRFRVSVHARQDEAGAALHKYETAPQHKQTYFIREAGDGSTTHTTPARA